MQGTDTKIKILVDDRAGEGLVAEHGLSMWIETGGRRILFDTGQGGALAPNAVKLGADLGRTDLLVLSHGHYDHTGAVAGVVQAARNVRLYCHPAIIQPKYAVRDGGFEAIGMPLESLTSLDAFPRQSLHWIQNPEFLSGEIGMTGFIPRETDYEDTGGSFYLDPEKMRPDPMTDDLALWIRTNDGLIVCVGCAHAGLVNTLDHIRRQSGISRIRAVIGGFHLLNAARDRIEKTIDALRRMKPETMIPCHCTGKSAIEALQEAFGGVVSPGESGMSFRF